MLKFSSIQKISSKKWLLKESKKYIKVASFYDRLNNFDESDSVYANAISMMRLAQEQEDDKEPDEEYQTEDIDPNPLSPESPVSLEFKSRFGLPGYSEDEVFSGYGMGLDPAVKYTTQYAKYQGDVFGFYLPKISGQKELVNSFIQALSVGGGNVLNSLKSLAENYKELYEEPSVRNHVENAVGTALAYYYKNPLLIRLEMILGSSYYTFEKNLREGASGVDATTVKFIKDINDQKQQRSEAYNNYLSTIRELMAQYNIPQDIDVINYFYRVYFGNNYNIDLLKQTMSTFKYDEFRFAASITSGSQNEFFKNLNVVSIMGINFVKKFMEVRGLKNLTEFYFKSIMKFKSSNRNEFDKKSLLNQKLILPFIDKVSDLLIDFDVEESKLLTRYDLVSIIASFTPEEFAQKIKDGVIVIGGNYGGTSLPYVSALQIKSKMNPEDLEYLEANNRSFNLEREVVVLKLVAEKGKEIVPFLVKNLARFKFVDADKEAPLFDFNVYFDYVVKYEDEMNELYGCSHLNKMYSIIGNDILKYRPVEIFLMADHRNETGGFFRGHFPITPEIIDKYAEKADMKFLKTKPDYGYEITISKEQTENANQFIEDQFGKAYVDNRKVNYLLFCLGKIDFNLLANIGNFLYKTQQGIPYSFKDRLKSISDKGFFIGDINRCGGVDSFGDIHKDSVASVSKYSTREEFDQEYEKVKYSIERTSLYQNIKPGTPEYEKIFLTLTLNFRSRNRNPNLMLRLFDDILDSSIYNTRDSEYCRSAQLLAGNDLTSFTPRMVSKYSVASTVLESVIETKFLKEYQDFINLLHSKSLYELEPEKIQEYINEGKITEEEINNLFPKYFSLNSILTNNLDEYNNTKRKFVKYYIDNYFDKTLLYNYDESSNLESAYKSIIEKDVSKEEFESVLQKLFTSQEPYIPLKYPSYILSGTTMYLNDYGNKVLENVRNASVIIQIFNKLAEPMLDIYSKKQYGMSYANLSPDKRRSAIHDLANTLPDNTNQEMMGFGEYFINNYSQVNKIKLKLIGNMWSSYINIYDENKQSAGEQLVKELSKQTSLEDLFKKIKLSSMAELIEDVNPQNDDFLLEFVNHYGAGSDTKFSSEEQKSIYSSTEQVYIEGLSVPLPDWASFDKTIQKNKKDKIRLRFLPREDARGIFIGIYAECCQHPTSYAASCAFDGQANPNSAFMSIELNDEWIGAGYVWTNEEGGLCIDSIETIGNDLFHSTTNKELFMRLLMDFSNSLGDRTLTMGYGKVNFNQFEEVISPLGNDDKSVIEKYIDYITSFNISGDDQMYSDANSQRIVPKNP